VTCQHLKTKRGKDIPRLYGSWQSEVCVDCGMFRRRDHHWNLATGWLSGWFDAADYEAATEEREWGD